jgi:signal transduction histidine kinase
VHHFSKDELRWLELVGRSAGSLLHHVELTERLRGMAVLQERTRLAQEIHDGLVQLLGSLRLWAEEAQIALSEADQVAVQAAVKKIEATSRDAYNSLREEMLGLRSSITPGLGMVPVLKEYLNRFQRQWEINAQLVLDGFLEDGGDLQLSPAAEIQLLRIIQESMTNVRRHAEASQVTVRFVNQPGQLVVEIEDDGKGFEPARVAQESMGLRIMRERAAGIGGRIELHSQANQGTYLRFLLPRAYSALSPRFA